ncbi:hypothetical protein GCM10022205_49840 [Spinactinospora alkalitolerans]
MGEGGDCLQALPWFCGPGEAVVRRAASGDAPAAAFPRHAVVNERTATTAPTPVNAPTPLSPEGLQAPLGTAASVSVPTASAIVA